MRDLLLVKLCDMSSHDLIVVCVLVDIGPMLDPDGPVELGEWLEGSDAVDIDLKLSLEVGLEELLDPVVVSEIVVRFVLMGSAVDLLVV